MNALRFMLGLAVAAGGICPDAFATDRPADVSMTTPPALARSQSSLTAFDGAVDWLNAKPLGPAALRGKVVLVDFWTYSCINWQRTLPYIRAWADKYKDQGLVVIGVHTPEFSFEKDVANVGQATARLKVDYPVAVDTKYAIWRAFDNQYWPALYFIDASGKVRHHHFGEGDYERSEKVIQQLLSEAGAKNVGTSLVRVDAVGSQAAADLSDLKSPETYVGHDRTENFVSPGGMTLGRARSYAVPQSLPLNTWALSGVWKVGPETVRLERANGRIAYRFHARDLHLVMGAATPDKPVPFRVLIDGRAPGSAHGADVDEQGRGVLVEHRLYQLIRQPMPIEDRQFEIEFLEPGAEAYSFTFG